MDVKIDTIIRSPRKTIALQIEDGKIVVKAPYLAPRFVIDRFVRKHQEWIIKAKAKLQLEAHHIKQYKDGEEFLFLGEIYHFTIGNYKTIQLKDTSLYFPKFLLFRVKKELESWYKEQALKYLIARVEHYAERMQVSYNGVSIADTKSRWGACSPDNRLEFSWRLIMAPLSVFDSVVVHELAHTLVKNHSGAFWRHVFRVKPGYKAYRQWLNHNSRKLVV